MSAARLNIDLDYFDRECDFSDLKEATEKLCSASENQFSQIQKEKWYTRLFDTITFSKKKEKRLAANITNLAQAQQVLIELLIRLSARDTKIAALVEQSFDEIAKLSSSSVKIAEAVKILRDRCILGLGKSGDIGDLSGTDKEILAGILLTVTELFNELSEAQQKYNDAVLRYINIIDPQHIDLSKALREVTDNTVRRKMLVCAMELAFLHGLSFDFEDRFSDFIDEFDFGGKTIREVKENIQKSHKLRGIDGFYNKYGHMDYEGGIAETFMLDVEQGEDDDDTSESGKKSAPVLEKYTLEMMLCIERDEVLTIENKDIILHANIECEGGLEFRNCRITYDATDFRGIIELKGDDADVSFVKCLIVQKPTLQYKKYSGNYFIGGSYAKNRVEFTDCTMIKCMAFLDAVADVFFNNCLIENSLNDFVGNNVKNFLMLNCEVKFKDLNLFDETYIEDIFSNYSGESFSVRNTRFTSDGSSSAKNCRLIRTALYGDGFGEIYNCEFVNLNNLTIEGIKSIKNCYFKNCETDDELILRPQSVTGSLFVDCGHMIIRHEQDGDAKKAEIDFCKFVNIFNTNKKDDFRMNTAVLCFGKFQSKKIGMSAVTNCVFSGVRLKNAVVIGGFILDKIEYPCVKVERCTFDNCVKKEDADGSIELIKKEDYYLGMFSREKTQTTARVADCTGLDRVNSGGNGVVEFDGNMEIFPGLFAGLENADFQCGIPQGWLEAFSGEK